MLFSKYYFDDTLFAVGFLDLSIHSLSSVYFIHRKEFFCRGPGIFSILQEIQFARSIGLRYYYLGYIVKGNAQMAYKASFFSHERLDRETGLWDEF